MKKELKLFGILLVSGLILGACSNQKKGEKISKYLRGKVDCRRYRKI